MSGPPFAPAHLISGEPARGAWDFGAGIVPLNHGSYGAVPRAVTELQGRMQARADRSAIGWFPHTPAWVAQARAGLAGFVGAAADDTVFVRLSVHLYTTAADIDAFNDRAVPLLVEWSREPGAPGARRRAEGSRRARPRPEAARRPGRRRRTVS